MYPIAIIRGSPYGCRVSGCDSAVVHSIAAASASDTPCLAMFEASLAGSNSNFKSRSYRGDQALVKFYCYYKMLVLLRAIDPSAP